MNRPVAPLVYAATTRPLPSITKCTGGLEAIPAAHNVDIAASRRDSSKGPPWIHVSDADRIVMLPGLGAGAAASGGAPVGGAGTTRAYNRTRAAAATDAETVATCLRRDGSVVAPSRSRITRERPWRARCELRRGSVRRHAGHDETSRPLRFLDESDGTASHPVINNERGLTGHTDGELKRGPRRARLRAQRGAYFEGHVVERVRHDCHHSA
jgi:hypothetical protein